VFKRHIFAPPPPSLTHGDCEEKVSLCDVVSFSEESLRKEVEEVFFCMNSLNETPPPHLPELRRRVIDLT